MYLRKCDEEYIRSIAEIMLEQKTWRSRGEHILEIMDKLDAQRKGYNEYMHTYLKKRAFEKGGKKK